jgi:hypothetical protein
MNGPDDDRLAELLTALGERLALPDAPAVEPTAGDRDVSGGPPLRHRHRRRPADPHRSRWARWAPLAAAAAVLAAVILAVAPVREAVADWLGIGSTRIEHEPAPPGTTAALPGIGAGVTSISEEDARARMPAELPAVLDPAPLGAPATFAAPPEGGVLVGWPDGTTLWIHRADLDLGMVVKKVTSPANTIRSVAGVGDEALLIEGPHRVTTPYRTVAAQSTIIWRTGSVERRLESDRPAEELIALARVLAG